MRFSRRTASILAVALGAICVFVAAGSVVHARLFGTRPAEHPAIALPVEGPALHPDAEISGLAWHGDRLVLLPQYPHRFPIDGYDGSLFAIARAQLDEWRDGQRNRILPEPVPVRMPGLMERPGYQGFEAIAFRGDDVYLSVEMDDDGSMSGLLVKGHVRHEADGHLELDVDRSVTIAPQTGIRNLAYEALTVIDDRVVVFYEANGAANEAPHALAFDLDLRPLGELPIDPLEYRLTDATDAEADGRFFAANYHYPESRWPVGECALRARYGDGDSHAEGRAVERIVELRLSNGRVALTGRPPIQLALGPEARNWEGIVRYRDGFIVATDKHPVSMLAFVPL